MSIETNGAALPPAREAVVEQGNRLYQEVAHERDMLRRELSDAQTTIAGYKVALEAHASKDAMNDSRIMELQIKTDNAVGRRAELETILQSIQALLRTFLIGHEPLIQSRTEDAPPD
jgi:DNA-binding transcriptional MerR regulator